MKSISTEKKHILIASGEPRFLAEVKTQLISHYEVSIAATAAAILTALERYEIAAIIIDISENRDNAFSLVNAISELAKEKSVPVIFLAEKDNVDDEAGAFAAGAADYAIRRPGTTDALIYRINLRISASENEELVKRYDDGGTLTVTEPVAVLADKTILVVDDVELNRDMIGGMLEEIKGLTLDFAANGEEAVTKYALSSDRYALILMDVQMPVMSGTEATKKIRGLDRENARDIPIIALTAGVEEEEVASYLEAGMNDFLQKPMDYNQLLNTVSKYISKK